MLIETGDKNHNNNHDFQDSNESKNDNDYAVGMCPDTSEKRYDGCPEEEPESVSGCNYGSCILSDGTGYLPIDLKCKFEHNVCLGPTTRENAEDDLRCDGETGLKEIVWQCGQSGLDREWEIISGQEFLHALHVS